MEWYVWLGIGIGGVVVVVVLLGFFAVAIGAIASAVVFSMTYFLMISFSVTSILCAVYIPVKGKKWLRHGWFLNTAKILFAPFGFTSIPIAYVQGKIIEKLGIGR